MKKNIFIVFLLFVLSGFHVSSQFQFDSHWEDDFKKKEKEHLINWIQSVGDAVEMTLGTYPFKVQIYFHRSTEIDEPVPWAHTSRNGEEAVHFYVNPEFSIEELISDWTAAHEISHLSIPFLGQENSWFAEGFASYFQWQIMFNQGVISKSELNEKYISRLASTLPKFKTDRTFIEVVQQLKKQHDYPAYYYGGACFFIQINQQLIAQKDMQLSKIIADFQLSGRLQVESIEELIKKLDDLTESQLFSVLLQSFESDPSTESIGKTNYF